MKNKTSIFQRPLPLSIMATIAIILCVGALNIVAASAAKHVKPHNSAPAVASTPAIAPVVPPATLQVAEFGDSISSQANPYLKDALSAATSTKINIVTNAFLGTATCDWFSTMQNVADTYHPQVVIIEFLGNTFTPCIAGAAASGGEAVASQYAQDIIRATRIFLDAGTQKVIIMGGPTVRGSSSNSVTSMVRIAESSAVYAINNPSVSYYSAGSWVDVPGTDASTPTLPCTTYETANNLCIGPVVNGVKTNTVRSPDGTHFCLPDDNSSSYSANGFCAGAWRFGNAEATAIEEFYNITPLPVSDIAPGWSS